MSLVDPHPLNADHANQIKEIARKLHHESPRFYQIQDYDIEKSFDIAHVPLNQYQDANIQQCKHLLLQLDTKKKRLVSNALNADKCKHQLMGQEVFHTYEYNSNQQLIYLQPHEIKKYRKNEYEIPSCEHTQHYKTIIQKNSEIQKTEDKG